MKTIVYTRIFHLAFCILVYHNSNAQVPSFQWVKAIGGTGYDVGNAIAVDPESGDVYTTGVFSGRVDFDSGSGIFNLTATGDNDLFISKSNASGYFEWTEKIGGTLNDVGFSIAVNGSGDVYITGQFSKTVDFDPGVETFNLTSAGIVDIFILKLDSNGKFIWARSIGGLGYDVGKALAVDPTGKGDIYIKGEFSGTVDFDPGAFSFYLTAAGYKGIFILKLNDAGNFVWAKGMEVEAYGGFGQTIIVDAFGNVYTTGWFQGTVDFGFGTETYNLTASGINDIFILKLDASGNFVWAKRMGGTLQGVGISLGVDASGNVYTTGTFNGTIDFDPGKGEYNLTARSTIVSDIFISKLDGSGNFVWAKGMGGTSGDGGNAIVVDPDDGDIYTIGNFSETADFDPEKGIFYLTSSGELDVYISKLNSAGNFVWAIPIGGVNADYGYSLALNASGNVHIIGGFRSSSISFGPIALSNEGDYDIFIAKLNVSIPLSVVDSKRQPIAIFPNPTKDHLKIEFGEEALHHVRISLFTMGGEIVFSTTDNNISHDMTFDISGLPAAIYFVEVNVNGNKMVKQVVKAQE